MLIKHVCPLATYVLFKGSISATLLQRRILRIVFYLPFLVWTSIAKTYLTYLSEMPFALIWLYCEFAFEILLRNLRKFILIWIRSISNPGSFSAFWHFLLGYAKKKILAKSKIFKRPFLEACFFLNFINFELRSFSVFFHEVYISTLFSGLK